MNTLADEFLADLGEEEIKEENEKVEQDDEEEQEEMDIDVGNAKLTDPKTLTKLLGSERLTQALDKIAKTPKVRTIVGHIEQDPEYQLIVEANGLTLDITQEITKLHKFIKELYKVKFPELESIIYNAVDYAKAVQRIGNETELSKLDLNDILPGSTVMVVKVSFTSTSGTQIEESDLNLVKEGIDLLLQLDSARKKIVEYVETRMHMVAPNVTALVGSATAAKMMSLAGGLVNLSRMSPATLETLGSNRKALGGLSTSNLRVNGFLAESEFVLKTPSDLRRKAVKLLSGKICLAARVDSYHEDPSGAAGKAFLDDVERKIQKILEPPPLKEDKPLPAPDDRPKKRRGGRRMRKLKQKFEMTELRKQANRTPFGLDAQEEIGDSGKGMGFIGLAGGGKLRVSAVDKGILKKTKKFSGSSGTTSGLSSSLAFTPVQGIELVNPQAAAQKIKEANEKYFGQSVIKKKP